MIFGIDGSVGKRITDLRVRRELTVEALAEKVGLDPCDLDILENDDWPDPTDVALHAAFGEDVNPDANWLSIQGDVLLSIAFELDTSVEYLLGMVDDPRDVEYLIDEVFLVRLFASNERYFVAKECAEILERREGRQELTGQSTNDDMLVVFVDVNGKKIVEGIHWRAPVPRVGDTITVSHLDSTADNYVDGEKHRVIGVHWYAFTHQEAALRRLLDRVAVAVFLERVEETVEEKVDE